MFMVVQDSDGQDSVSVCSRLLFVSSTAHQAKTDVFMYSHFHGVSHEMTRGQQELTFTALFSNLPA